MTHVTRLVTRPVIQPAYTMPVTAPAYMTPVTAPATMPVSATRPAIRPVTAPALAAFRRGETMNSFHAFAEEFISSTRQSVFRAS